MEQAENEHRKLLHSNEELLQMLTWLIHAKLQKFGLSFQSVSLQVMMMYQMTCLYNQVNGLDGSM